MAGLLHRCTSAGRSRRRAGYLSHTFLSESDDTWKFGVAAPIYEGDRWIGVLMATIGTDSSLVPMRLDDERGAGTTAILVALQDRSRANPDAAGKYVVILHDALKHEEGVPIDSPRLQQFIATRTEPSSDSG